MKHVSEKVVLHSQFHSKQIKETNTLMKLNKNFTFFFFTRHLTICVMSACQNAKAVSGLHYSLICRCTILSLLNLKAKMHKIIRSFGVFTFSSSQRRCFEDKKEHTMQVTRVNRLKRFIHWLKIAFDKHKRDMPRSLIGRCTEDASCHIQFVCTENCGGCRKWLWIEITTEKFSKQMLFSEQYHRWNEMGG